MAIPSPDDRVEAFDARLVGRPTGDQFTLATTERRYRESLTSTSSSVRDLAAFEYITALEEALHGKQPTAAERAEIKQAASITAAVGLGALPQWAAMRGAV